MSQADKGAADRVELCAAVRELAGAIQPLAGRPALPAAAVSRILDATEAFPREAKQAHARDVCALAARVQRELAQDGDDLTAQLLFVAALLLGDLGEAADLFGAAGMKGAQQRLLGMPGFDAKKFEARDPQLRTGLLNLLTSKDK